MCHFLYLDARANEAVLAQLKQSLEDQDVAFELQEQKNTQTEEELAALRKGRCEVQIGLYSHCTLTVGCKRLVGGGMPMGCRCRYNVW